MMLLLIQIAEEQPADQDDIQELDSEEVLVMKKKIMLQHPKQKQQHQCLRPEDHLELGSHQTG